MGVSNPTPDLASQAKEVQVRHVNANFNACVLVVEDHEDTRLLFKTLLEARGANVVEAENGEMATALAESVQLDLIVIDGSLPLLDGFEATSRIRERSSTRDVPIVFISGDALPASQAKAFAVGCTDYLVKPIDFDAWDRLLERYLPLVKGFSKPKKDWQRTSEYAGQGTGRSSDDLESRAVRWVSVSKNGSSFRRRSGIDDASSFTSDSRG